MIREQERALAIKRAQIIKAIAHPSRMYIVTRLFQGDASVGQLVQSIGSDVSTVSKHLSIMKQAGLLADKRVGTKVLYSLRCPCIMEFIHCIDDVIVEDAQRGISCVLSQSLPKETAQEE